MGDQKKSDNSPVQNKCFSGFTLSPEDAARVATFKAMVEKKIGKPNAGAIGGATTYEFTPTSLGTVIIVRHFGEELDLTDYEAW